MSSGLASSVTSVRFGGCRHARRKDVGARARDAGGAELRWRSAAEVEGGRRASVSCRGKADFEVRARARWRIPRPARWRRTAIVEVAVRAAARAERGRERRRVEDARRIIPPGKQIPRFAPFVALPLLWAGGMTICAESLRSGAQLDGATQLEGPSPRSNTSRQGNAAAPRHSSSSEATPILEQPSRFASRLHRRRRGLAFRCGDSPGQGHGRRPPRRSDGRHSATSRSTRRSAANRSARVPPRSLDRSARACS